MTRVPAEAIQRYARGTAIGAVAIAASWHVANNLFCTVTGWSQYRWPLLAVAAWLVVALFTVLGAVNMLARNARRRIGLALVGLPALLCCVEAVIVATRGPEVISNANWGLDSFGWYAMLLLWRFRLRWFFAALALNWVVSFVVVLATGPVDRIEVSRYVIVMYTSAAAQIVVAGGARLLQRNAERAARASMEQAELDAGRAAAEAVQADRERRYREIGDAVRELLAGLAGGALSPDDPAVQRRCAVEASRLRRLIAEHDDVPSPLVHELRACADVAERRDVAVALEIAGTLPPLPRQVRRALTEAPMHVLAGARSHARVTVFAGAEPREVEVSVVADAVDGFDPDLSDINVIWSREGDTHWVRAHWTDQ
jgi:hypothetical protein